MEDLKKDLREIKHKLDELSAIVIARRADLEIQDAKRILVETRVDRLEALNKWTLGLMVSSAVAVCVKLWK